jgi:hypothetical protein
MAYDRFLIAPMEGGLQNDLKPWLIPDDAFEEMDNCYIYRGRVRKRFGSRLMNGDVSQTIAQLSSRLRIQVGTIDSPSSPVPGTVFEPGQLFSAGSQIFTVYQTGTPADMLATGVGTGTYNTTTGAFVLSGTGLAGSTPIYFYPAQPVMGLIRYEVDDSTADPTFAFDTQFAYTFTSGAWAGLGTAVSLGSTDGSGDASGTVSGSQGTIGQTFTIGTQIFTVTASSGALTTTGAGSGTFNTSTGVYSFTGAAATTAITWNSLGAFTGDDSQFFWGANWRGALASDRILFVVNNNAADGIKYYSASLGAWTTMTPQVLSTPTYLFTALILVIYKGYMVALNTTEGADVGSAVQYTNRARWARYGNPIPGSGGDANIWRSDVAGNGNFIEAATSEAIVSCGFIKDQLIVYFERSTWTLKQTNNYAQPFSWYKVNTELGAESTFSAVPFDKVLLGIGSTGIHACTGTNVDRIDEKIPDTVWDIHTGANEVDRVIGIRDYYAEQVYWTFPTATTNSYSSTYPNKVLVYNYKSGSWAFNDDSITMFGYYYPATQSAVTWADTEILWNDEGVYWSAGATQPLSQVIIAGNQEGFTFIVDPDLSVNASVLQITNITLVGSEVSVNCINHNLNVAGVYSGDYVALENLNGLTGTFTGQYPVISITDANNFLIIADDIYAALNGGDVYTGGGTMARVSIINLLTKQFNFYVQEDRNCYVQKVDCLVGRTSSGEITVDYQVSSGTNGTIPSSIANGAIVGNNILETTPYDLYPLEQQQARLWHPVYFQSDGTSTQLRFYLSAEQMLEGAITSSDFQLHGMLYYVIRTSSRLQ